MALQSSRMTGTQCSLASAGRVARFGRTPAISSEDPIAKLVLAVSTTEGLATDQPWTDGQQELISGAAAWLEHAQQIAGHASPKTTKLYDRTADTVTIDEIFSSTVPARPR